MTNNPGNELIDGFFIGAFVVGFIWMCASIANKAEGYEYFYEGFNYTTKKAIRMAGKDGERISKDGQWVKSITSIWRTDFDNKLQKRRYFVLQLDELRPAKIFPVSENSAKEWIKENIDDEEYAHKLIRDFM